MVMAILPVQGEKESWSIFTLSEENIYRSEWLVTGRNPDKVTPTTFKE